MPRLQWTDKRITILTDFILDNPKTTNAAAARHCASSPEFDGQPSEAAVCHVRHRLRESGRWERVVSQSMHADSICLSEYKVFEHLDQQRSNRSISFWKQDRAKSNDANRVSMQGLTALVLNHGTQSNNVGGWWTHPNAHPKCADLPIWFIDIELSPYNRLLFMEGTPMQRLSFSAVLWNHHFIDPDEFVMPVYVVPLPMTQRRHKMLFPGMEPQVQRQALVLFVGSDHLYLTTIRDAATNFSRGDGLEKHSLVQFQDGGDAWLRTEWQIPPEHLHDALRQKYHDTVGRKILEGNKAAIPAARWRNVVDVVLHTA